MKRHLGTLLLTATAGAAALSAISPHDSMTWVLEAMPVFILAPILVVMHRRRPLTPLLQVLLFLHALILLLGAHYTYARVPLGELVGEWLGAGRNHYDRLGHFAQGFVPAILVREMLVRSDVVRRGAWMFLLVTCACLAFSAFYELLEWWSAVLLGDSATDFLGTQGDPWDTQWDMALALAGALVAQLLSRGSHDRQLALIPPAPGQRPDS